MVAFDDLRDALSAIFGLSELKIVPTGRVKVPTGRVKVPASRYVVPIGRVSKVLLPLSPGYIANSKLKEDDEDHEEDPADYPADGGDNYDNESSDDDNDDDDVDKDKEDEEEEEHLCFDRPFCGTYY
ncbi:hypothetical protein Tco_0971499 [Tanacetum coccineum]